MAKTFLKIELKEGVTNFHVITFLFLCLFGIPITTFVGFIQPYVLTQQLLIPEEIQGNVTGNIVFYTEFVLLACSALAGVLIDRKGRRFVSLAGFVIMTIGYLLYAFVETYWELQLLRFWFAIGIGCVSVMVSTVMADIPAEHARGKLVGLGSCFIGFGSVFLGLVLAKLPSYFSNLSGEETAGLYSFITVAGLAVFLFLISTIGIRPFPATTDKDASQGKTVVEQLAIGLRAAKDNIKIAIAYGSAFVSRGDLVVIGTFYSLWIKQEGLMQGLSTEEAIKTAGMFFVIVQTAALFWAPVAGIINDKLNRLSAIIVSLLLAAVGYGAMGLIQNPLGTEMYIGAIFLGIGQIAVVIGSQTLIGQEAPENIRGNVVGMFTVFGAIGILFITKVGGMTYDSWNASPFVIVAGANLLLALWAFLVLQKEQRQPANESSQ